MKKFKLLLKVAKTAGPAVLLVMRTYGPQIKQLIEENPELFDTIKNRLTAIAPGKKSKRGIDGLQTRIGVLREQTTYLYASANNVSVAEQATAWRHELDALESALPVIDAMGSKQRRTQMKTIELTIDGLSAKILELTLQDDIEDAEIVDE